VVGALAVLRWLPARATDAAVISSSAPDEFEGAESQNDEVPAGAIPIDVVSAELGALASRNSE
jgi:hypothetical protein